MPHSKTYSPLAMINRVVHSLEVPHSNSLPISFIVFFFFSRPRLISSSATLHLIHTFWLSVCQCTIVFWPASKYRYSLPQKKKKKYRSAWSRPWASLRSDRRLENYLDSSRLWMDERMRRFRKLRSLIGSDETELDLSPDSTYREHILKYIKMIVVSILLERRARLTQLS